jgi:hypothetical protein
VRALAIGTSFLAAASVSSFPQIRWSCSSSALDSMAVVDRRVGSGSMTERVNERSVTSADINPVIHHNHFRKQRNGGEIPNQMHGRKEALTLTIKYRNSQQVSAATCTRPPKLG